MILKKKKKKKKKISMSTFVFPPPCPSPPPPLRAKIQSLSPSLLRKMENSVARVWLLQPLEELF